MVQIYINLKIYQKWARYVKIFDDVLSNVSLDLGIKIYFSEPLLYSIKNGTKQKGSKIH